MSIGNNIIDASRDLIISIRHITYLSIISFDGSGDLSLIVGNNIEIKYFIEIILQMRLMI